MGPYRIDALIGPSRQVIIFLKIVLTNSTFIEYVMHFSFCQILNELPSKQRFLYQKLLQLFKKSFKNFSSSKIVAKCMLPLILEQWNGNIGQKWFINHSENFGQDVFDSHILFGDFLCECFCV